MTAHRQELRPVGGAARGGLIRRACPNRACPSRSRRSRRGTIKPKFSLDQPRQINHLAPDGVLAPASTASPPLRRSPPCRLGEPGPTPPARRLQEDADPAEGAQERPTLLGRAVEGVGRLVGARKWWAAKDSNIPPTALS